VRKKSQKTVQKVRYCVKNISQIRICSFVSHFIYIVISLSHIELQMNNLITLKKTSKET